MKESNNARILLWLVFFLVLAISSIDAKAQVVRTNYHLVESINDLEDFKEWFNEDVFQERIHPDTAQIYINICEQALDNLTHYDNIYVPNQYNTTQALFAVEHLESLIIKDRAMFDPELWLDNVQGLKKRLNILLVTYK